MMAYFSLHIWPTFLIAPLIVVWRASLCWRVWPLKCSHICPTKSLKKETLYNLQTLKFSTYTCWDKHTNLLLKAQITKWYQNHSLGLVNTHHFLRWLTNKTNKIQANLTIIFLPQMLKRERRKKGTMGVITLSRYNLDRHAKLLWYCKRCGWKMSTKVGWTSSTYLFNILRDVIFLVFSCEWVHGEGLVGGCDVYGRFKRGTRCDHLL